MSVSGVAAVLGIFMVGVMVFVIAVLAHTFVEYLYKKIRKLK